MTPGRVHVAEGVEDETPEMEPGVREGQLGIVDHPVFEKKEIQVDGSGTVWKFPLPPQLFFYG